MTSKTINIPNHTQTAMITYIVLVNAYVCIEMYLFHIYYKKNELLDAKNYERHFPVKWWPFERLNSLYKLYFVHKCNE